MAKSSANHKGSRTLKLSKVFAASSLICLMLVSCTSNRAEQKLVNRVKFENVEFKVDVVSTNESRAKGLGQTDSLDRDRGLLFDFKSEGFYSFWMKDMNYSIDIIWIDSKLNVVYIKRSVSPSSYPKKFTSTLPARYVLEIGSGLSERYDITVGSKMQLVGR